MSLNPSNSSNLEEVALKGLMFCGDKMHQKWIFDHIGSGLDLNPFNATSSKLLLFEGLSAILV